MAGDMPMLRKNSLSARSALAACAAGALGLSACGPSPIHVNGVLRESSEMRPLRSLPQGAFAHVKVLVRAASEAGQEGLGPECGSTPLEGSEDHNNAACVPPDAGNAAIRLVRQRLRSYGMGVVSNSKEPHDYEVHVLVVGVAPKAPDPMQAKAVAKVTFKRDTESPGGFFGGIDEKAAAEAFDGVARDCALQDSELANFTAKAAQPMTPEFDIVALASDAVDNAVGCDQLARFFLDASTRFPRPAAPPAAPAPPAGTGATPAPAPAATAAPAPPPH
jgi:hypothetical protein